MRHVTKDKGDLGVAKTIPHLLEHGIRSCVPLSEHLPFDLIAVMPDFTTLRRVQVKYRKAKNNIIEITFRSNYYDSKKIYSKHVNFDEIDCYALFCPETNRTYYLRVDEIPSTAVSAHLRLQPPRNGQIKGIRLAHNYAKPSRIAESAQAMPPRWREVSELDEIAISHVIAHLVEQGIQPFFSMSQYLPFDLIAVMPDMKTLRRMRIGYQRVAVNPYVDLYAVYQPEGQQINYIEANSVSSGTQWLTIP